LSQYSAGSNRKDSLGPRVDGDSKNVKPVQELGGEDTIHNILADIHDMGIVGEDDTALGIYIVGTSRLLQRPLATIVFGDTSGGKSHLVDTIGGLFPDDQVIRATSFSDKSLYYMPNSIAHKFMIAGERSKKKVQDGGDDTSARRQLISERKISQWVTVKGPNGSWVSVNKVIKGPVAYAETTTLEHHGIDRQDLNRVLRLRIDESVKQTGDIIDELSGEWEDMTLIETQAIIERHHQFQHDLEESSVNICIPYARKLGKALPRYRMKMRRVIRQIHSMIRTITLLHHKARETDAKGHLVATMTDYILARRLLQKPLEDVLDISDAALDFFSTLKEKLKDTPEAIFPTTFAQGLTDASERTVRNWLTSLTTYKYMRHTGGAKGQQAANWQLNGKPLDGGMLPAWESIKD
jgi:hypothetical protein